MKWTEVSFVTSQEATETVANLFHELGAGGVVIEDPAIINRYKREGRWDYCDIPDLPEGDVTVTAYLPVNEDLPGKLTYFHDMIAQIREQLDVGTAELSCRDIQEDDWANSWKEFYHPVRVGDHLVIKPSWEQFTAQQDDIVLEMDPGMAFGTGTHPTTVLCLETLEQVITAHTSVLDIGTGSGILSIIAAKLGAPAVLAIDIDPVAVRVAAANVQANQTDDVVRVQRGNLLDGVDYQADIVVANIVADVIIKLLPAVPASLRQGGLLIVSGIIEERLDEVTEAMEQHDFTIRQVQADGGWCCITAVRN